MANKKTPHHIQSVRIADLFGRYTYSLPAKDQELSDLNIIYGNNGAGKTTLLSLMFHMLSPSDRRGHRGYISETPFSSLEIRLNDGTVVSAKKDAQLLIGPVLFSILKPNAPKIEWNFTPGHERNLMRIEDLPAEINIQKLPTDVKKEVTQIIAKRDFHLALSKLEIVAYMLTSDRILLGDLLEPDEKDIRSELRTRERLSKIVSENRTAAVAEAMQSASNWVQRKYFEKSYGGSESSINLYEEVIKRIAKTTYKTKTGLNKSQEERVILNLKTMILDLGKRSREFSKYGLGGHTISPEMVDVINTTKGNRLNLINSILDPYLGGLKARVDGIYPLFVLIDNFVTSVNKFLKDKRLHYTVRTGFKILIDPLNENHQEILPAQLSSGEQQLVLLFCYVLTSRDKPSIFIIDEPEISLNIIWQRMLVDSLQELVKEAETQFIFASHSMEILSKHKGRVISLQETKT